MRYSLSRAEALRKELKLSPEEFSIRLQYNFASYPAAVERGYLTRRMAREICMRFGIPMSEFEKDGGNQ